jgi:hypothetical protein
MRTCEVVKTWEPLRFCGSIAWWRYPASGGGHMYLCDEHGIVHINQCEAAPPGGWDSPAPLDV